MRSAWPDLQRAVTLAMGLTPQGGVVLFSPGAPTPDGGGGYEERSRPFPPGGRTRAPRPDGMLSRSPTPDALD